MKDKKITVSEAIYSAKMIRPSRYDENTLIEWLSELDGRISVEIHKSSKPISYSFPEDETTELCVPHPYSGIYSLYLIAMCDYFDHETERYQNDIEMFNALMQGYHDYYLGTHPPKFELKIKLPHF